MAIRTLWIEAQMGRPAVGVVERTSLHDVKHNFQRMLDFFSWLDKEVTASEGDGGWLLYATAATQAEIKRWGLELRYMTLETLPETWDDCIPLSRAIEHQRRTDEANGRIAGS